VKIDGEVIALPRETTAERDVAQKAGDSAAARRDD
jgi:hypothetical protein